MGTEYRVDVVNNSPDTVGVCLYQRDPGGGWDAIPVAWFVERCPANSRAGFSWTDDYSFVWGAGEVRPGAVFRAAGSLPASPDGPGNLAVFDGNGCRLDRSPSQPGSFMVRTDAGIGQGMAVGIGMSDRAITVAGAQPNRAYSFSPRQEYWLAAGSFEAGQVLDPRGVPGAVRVTFPGGASKMAATYGPDRQWKVVPA